MAERQSASDELRVSTAREIAPSSANGRSSDRDAEGPSPADPDPDPAGPATRGGQGTVPAGAAAGRPNSWFDTGDELPTQAMPVPVPTAASRQSPVPAAGGDGARAGDGPLGTAVAGAASGDDVGLLFEPRGSDQPTELFAAVRSDEALQPPSPPDTNPPDTAAPEPAHRRPLIVAAAVLGLLALLYVVDLVLGLGAIPRGVTVAGVHVGGLDRVAAQSTLRRVIEPRTTHPVPVTAGQVNSEIDPRTSGLRIDWDATLDRAGSQPLNPITRITSFFSDREVGVVTDTDEQALSGALEQLTPVVDRAPAEGNVSFQGTTPLPVDPVPGQHLDIVAAAEVLRQQWANGVPIALPLTQLPPITSPHDVQVAIDTVARPAVSGPVTVIGEKNIRATLGPEAIAKALSFSAEPGKGLVPQLNQVVIEDALRPQLASTETPGRNATVNFASGAPVVVPSQDGRGIDYTVTLKDLLRVLIGNGPREITAVYGEQPAQLTTEKLKGLGITGVISEFTTGGFKADSGTNIKRAADQINGTIVQPGETFSLNGATEPRDAAEGYVEAGIIDDGVPSRGIGGGVSQLATTLYNAAYFAGMVDVAHKEHSFYISRYPAGREATVFEGAIDLKFRNDNPTGVLIQTVWTPASITVRMYGTKRYEVTSTPGPRTNPTQPQTVTIPKGKPCTPSAGGPGFTITDTRTLREISTGATHSETRTVRYNPSPIVVCEQ